MRSVGFLGENLGEILGKGGGWIWEANRSGFWLGFCEWGGWICVDPVGF